MKFNLKHPIRYGLAIILLIVLATALGACSTTPTTSITSTATPTNTSTSASSNTSTPSASAASLATLSEFTVMPASPDTLAVGNSLQFIAMGIYSDNSTSDITSQIKWASSDKNIATISSTGIATGLAPGSTNITGTILGASTPAIVLNVVGSETETEATLSSIAVSPASTSNLLVGDSQQFAAVGIFSDVSTVDLTSQATWTTSDDTIALISSVGSASAVGIGSTNITAAVADITSGPAVLYSAMP